MYEELVSRLREEAEWAEGNEWEVPIMLPDHLKQAADAIEKLSAIRDEQKAQIILMAAEIEEQKPRWISVEERLPEEDGEYLVRGRWRGKPTEIWICKCITLGPVKGWANSVANPAISHWQPLPEPPKEEET